MTEIRWSDGWNNAARIVTIGLMTQTVPPIVNDRFAPRLAFFYAAFFAAAGLTLPFFPLWLSAKGLDAAAIGIVLALPQFLRLAAIPAGTRLADRRGALKGPLVAMALMTVIAMLWVALADGFVAILSAFALAAIFSAPVLPLGDAYALKGLAARGLGYGPVRLWGSVAFMAANLGGGLMLGALAPVHLIWPILAGYCAIALAALLLAPLPAAPRTDARASHRHLRSLPFLAVMAAASLTQASHAVYYGFSTLAWSAQGLSGGAIGALWALGVAAEIVLFALAARLPRVAPTTLIALGAAGGVLRWAAMALDPPALWLPALQILHALSFGATHLGTMAYLAQAAPEGSRAAAQGDVATASGIAMALATALAGALYQRYGGAAYAAMAVLALAGGACALSARRL
jgi:MFS transporter, PPP family, 3-phenylpropionic acid transporter